MRHKLDAREYKLLLNPAKFSEDSSGSVDAFWNQRIKPLIYDRLGTRNGNEPRYEGQFDAHVERKVRFWDTANCMLSRADLALRERISVGHAEDSNSRLELTLKLRMPDMFVVGHTALPGCSNDASTDFEEDIAPLEVDDPQPGARAVVVSPKPSIRSRFSLSTTQTAEWGNAHPTLGDLQLLFSALPELVTSSGAPFEPGTTLVRGPDIRELVFKGARVMLGANAVGKFTLTLWYFVSAGVVPKVAEISFKCATDSGDMSGKAARRALKLFTGMQSELADWLNSEHSSKTALALPGAYGRPVE